MQFDIITLFPGLFDSFLNESLLFKARKKRLITVCVHGLRNYATDKHKTVDDKPYGGGPGMLLKVEPLVKALEAVQRKSKKNARVILLTPSGKQMTQKNIERYARRYEHIILLCGRYEGFDARIKKYVDEEVSVGPYVLNGGEVAAMALIEAASRLVPGVVGNPESLKEESHSFHGVGEYPQYTRPEIFRGAKVPRVLLSGDHGTISQWRKKRMKLRKTRI